MTRMLSPKRRTRALAVAALALAASVGFAAPAAAHTQVSPAAPEPGSTVTSGPVTVALTTTEPVLEAGQRGILVRGPGDEELYYGDGCATVTNGTTISTDITLGEPGEYTVIWSVVAEDSHVQSSDDFAPFTFTWDPADGEETAAGYTSVPVCGEEPPASADEQDDSSTDAEATAPATGDLPVANEHGWEDAGWIVAGVGILFIAAVLVVMIVVRRRVTDDDGADETDEDAESPDSPDDNT